MVAIRYHGFRVSTQEQQTEVSLIILPTVINLKETPPAVEVFFMQQLYCLTGRRLIMERREITPFTQLRLLMSTGTTSQSLTATIKALTSRPSPTLWAA